MLGERDYPAGVPQRLQDNASHALPMQMGVAFSQIEEPFDASLEPLTSIPYPSAAAVPSTPYVVLDARVNASYSAAFALLEQGADVYRSTGAIEGDGFQRRRAVSSSVIRHRSKVPFRISWNNGMSAPTGWRT